MGEAMRGEAEQRPGRVAIVPGLAFVLILAIAGRWMHQLLPGGWGKLLGEAVLGMGIGLLIGNAVRLSPRFQPGIQMAFGLILKTSIVLLGARISLQQIAEIGWGVVLLILLLIGLAMGLTRMLAGAAGISPKLGLLIGVGTAICGNTAITVTAPVIEAADEEVSFAIATNTLFGTLAVFAYPLLGRLLGFTDHFFGIWAGTAVNDTSQVVAAGMSYSLAAGELATAVKLTRNALMGFVIVAIGLWFHRDSEAPPCPGGRSGLWLKVKRSVPLFVFGFLAMALLNSFGAFDALSEMTGRNLISDLTGTAKFLILMALVGVGLNTRFDKLRCLGVWPLVIGFAASLTTAVTSFCVLRYVLHV
ncbi:Putative sulfate exporter family transporter [Sulfidibacter corallicola]